MKISTSLISGLSATRFLLRPTSHWLRPDRVPWFERVFLRRRIVARGYTLSPWSFPTIHEVRDVVEVLLHYQANYSLDAVMGPDMLEDWIDGPGRPGRNSCSLSDSH